MFDKDKTNIYFLLSRLQEHEPESVERYLGDLSPGSRSRNRNEMMNWSQSAAIHCFSLDDLLPKDRIPFPVNLDMWQGKSAPEIVSPRYEEVLREMRLKAHADEFYKEAFGKNMHPWLDPPTKEVAMPFTAPKYLKSKPPNVRPSIDDLIDE